VTVVVGALLELCCRVDWVVTVVVVLVDVERWCVEPPKRVVRPCEASEPPNISSGRVSAAIAMANATAAVTATTLA
jgi:hypothetical protein